MGSTIIVLLVSTLIVAVTSSNTTSVVMNETTSVTTEKVPLPFTTPIVTTSDDVMTTVEGGVGFCNTTVTYTVKTECTSCALSALIGCPPGLVQLTQVRISNVIRRHSCGTIEFVNLLVFQ